MVNCGLWEGVIVFIKYHSKLSIVMKKYIIIAYLFFSCSKERVPETYIFDASRDTSFIVSRSSSIPIRVDFDVTGQLEDSSLLVISYYKSKGNENIKSNVLLSPIVVSMKGRTFDFYDENASALFTFKHLNNKKGKLIIKASL